MAGCPLPVSAEAAAGTVARGMGLPQTTIAFLDESGVPEIPALARKPEALDNVFCFGLCFSGIHYWQEMKTAFRDACEAFGIPLDRELKWSNLMRKSGPARHLTDNRVYEFVEALTQSLDADKFNGVAVSLWKDEIWNCPGSPDSRGLAGRA